MVKYLGVKSEAAARDIGKYVFWYNCVSHYGATVGRNTMVFGKSILGV